jgi:hypothetical protein
MKTVTVTDYTIQVHLLLLVFQTDRQRKQTDRKRKQTDRQRKQFLAGDAPKNRQYMDLFLFITI